MKILLVGHGYVGSYLLPVLARAGLDVSVCDQNVDRLRGVPNAMRCRYQELTITDLADFSVILWFAGHSSVPMSLGDPDGALANNCLDLLHFSRRKQLDARLIYASTASVYSVMMSENGLAPPSLDESETRLRKRDNGPAAWNRLRNEPAPPPGADLQRDEYRRDARWVCECAQ